MVFSSLWYRRLWLGTSFSVLALFNLASAGKAQIQTETAIAESATPIKDTILLEDKPSLEPVFRLPPNSAAQLKEEQGEGVPQSSRAYLLPDGERLTRQGLQVINPRVQLSSLFGVPGLWVQGEYAYEFNDRYSMSAQGGYLWLGYSVPNVSWKPSFSYRLLLLTLKPFKP